MVYCPRIFLSFGYGQYGGSIEFSAAVAHDDNQPWYEGWSKGIFRTLSSGYASSNSASIEAGPGYSPDINHVDGLLGVSNVSSVSANVSAVKTITLSKSTSSSGTVYSFKAGAGRGKNGFTTQLANTTRE